MITSDYLAQCLATWGGDYTAKRTRLAVLDEYGEILGNYKKLLRGDYDETSEKYGLDQAGETGDILYYIHVCAKEYNITLPEDLYTYSKGGLKSYDELLQMCAYLSYKIYVTPFKFLLKFYLVALHSYLAELSKFHNTNIHDIMVKNGEKLRARAKAGTIKGSGSDR